MNKSFLVQLLNYRLYLGNDVVRRFTFKMMGTRDNCALLARANNQLSANFANTRGYYALFQKTDCFECLSPRKIVV